MKMTTWKKNLGQLRRTGEAAELKLTQQVLRRFQEEEKALQLMSSFERWLRGQDPREQDSGISQSPAGI